MPGTAPIHPPTDARVVVVGSGAAGLMAALAAAEVHRTPGDVLLLTDGPVGRSNTAMAQGGLQLPEAGRAAEAAFEEDILRSARVPVDRERVRRFVASVRPTVARLVDWGLTLERGPDGQPVRRLAGGMSAPRVVGSGSRIGPALVRLLRARLADSPVQVVDRTRVRDLEPGAGGVVVHADTGRLRGRAVVACTGGTTWREARRRGHSGTNPQNRNHSLSDRLVTRGLPEVTPSAFQYHPFGLVGSQRDGVGVCIPETIGAMGVRLLDRAGAEVAALPQDRLAVSRAMFAAADSGRALDGPGLRLTLSDLPPGRLEAALPKAWRRLERDGRTAGGVAEDVVVFPFLHYQLGGFAVDVRCRTPLPGLLLAGEMVGGIHGLNRLMGNGLTDSLVHGWMAGAEAAT